MLIKYKFRLDAICTNFCDEFCRFKRNCPEAELQKHCDNCHQFMTLYDLIETVYSDAYRQGQLAALPKDMIEKDNSQQVPELAAALRRRISVNGSSVVIGRCLAEDITAKLEALGQVVKKGAQE